MVISFRGLWLWFACLRQRIECAGVISRPQMHTILASTSFKQWWKVVESPCPILAATNLWSSRRGNISSGGFLWRSYKSRSWNWAVQTWDHHFSTKCWHFSFFSRCKYAKIIKPDHVCLSGRAVWASASASASSCQPILEWPGTNQNFV